VSPVAQSALTLTLALALFLAALLVALDPPPP